MNWIEGENAFHLIAAKKIRSTPPHFLWGEQKLSGSHTILSQPDVFETQVQAVQRHNYYDGMHFAELIAE